MSVWTERYLETPTLTSKIDWRMEKVLISYILQLRATYTSLLRWKLEFYMDFKNGYECTHFHNFKTNSVFR